jgi:hypothetical protein
VIVRTPPSPRSLSTVEYSKLVVIDGNLVRPA